MARIDQSGLRGQIRDRPIAPELETVLMRAAEEAGVDTVFVTSGGQPGSSGKSKGSSRHNGGRAADLHLSVGGQTQTFTDEGGGEVVERFITAAARHGANGIGAGEKYMGNRTIHVGFGETPTDHRQIVWGVRGKSRNAPEWLRRAAERGWANLPSEPAHGTDHRPDQPHRQPFYQPHVERPVTGIKGYPAEVIHAAQQAMRKWDIPASVTLAQWALESAHGTRMPPHSNNPFGIKARAGQPSVMAGTHEEVHGRLVRMQQPFRVYASLDEAFDDHGRLLAQASAYESARVFRHDPERFADALTHHYATDSNYGTKLKQIMRSANLYVFDHASGDFGSSSEVKVTQPLRLGDHGPNVTALQQTLTSLGYPLGAIDGKFGNLTRDALIAFQADNRVPHTGVLDTTTQDALNLGQRRPLGPDRTNAPAKHIGEKGSRIIRDADRNRMLSWFSTALGALGIGNSAVLNGSGVGTSAGTGVLGRAPLPDGVLPFIEEILKLRGTMAPEKVQAIVEDARKLKDSLTQGATSPELVELLAQLRRLISPEIAAKYPDLKNVLDVVAKTGPAKTGGMSTVLDILPTFFANDTVLQMISKGIALTAGSVIPGFGGSVGMLALGLGARYLSNRIVDARVQDHRSGGTITR